MKFKYSVIVIAMLAANQSFATEIQELAKLKVSSKSETTAVKVTSLTLENKQVTDIKGALNKIAGATVSNGVRYSQKAYLRGVEEHSANITIDGVRQDGQLFHHAGNQVIDTSMLKSVSVELGATSVLSGYGANTGSIRYETKNPLDLLQNGQEFGVRVGFSGDNATEYKQFNISGYGVLTDQFSVLAMYTKNENGDIETPNKTILNKHSDMKSGLLKAVYDIDESQQVVANFQSVEDSGRRAFSGEKPGRTTIEQLENYNGYTRDTYSIVYTNNSDSPLLDLHVNAYYNEKSMERGAFEASGKDGDLTYEERFPKRDYTYETTGLNIRNVSVVNDLIWTYGIEYFKSEQSLKANGNSYVKEVENGKTVLEENNNPTVSNGPTARLVSGYVQANLEFGDVTVIPGLRYDNYELGGIYDASFNKASPKISASWRATNDLLLKAGYGKIFKGPGLPELLFVRGSKTETPNAQAESGNHVEFNIDYNLSTITGLEQTNFYANVYQFTIDNQYHPTKNRALTNSSDFKNQGIETGINFNHKDLSGYINYSYNDGEKDFGTYKSDDLYSGSQEVNLGLAYQINDALLIGWDNTLVSKASLTEKYTDEGRLTTEKVKKKGYGVASIWATYQPQNIQGLKVSLAIDNLFDKAYQNHKSFGQYWGSSTYNDNEVGRNIKASINFEF